MFSKQSYARSCCFNSCLEPCHIVYIVYQQKHESGQRVIGLIHLTVECVHQCPVAVLLIDPQDLDPHPIKTACCDIALSAAC